MEGVSRKLVLLLWREGRDQIWIVFKGSWPSSLCGRWPARQEGSEFKILKDGLEMIRQTCYCWVQEVKKVRVLLLWSRKVGRLFGNVKMITFVWSYVKLNFPPIPGLLRLGTLVGNSVSLILYPTLPCMFTLPIVGIQEHSLTNCMNERIYIIRAHFSTKMVLWGHMRLSLHITSQG